MNAGKFFAGLSVLFFLVVSPLRGIAQIIGRIPLVNVPAIVGIFGGVAAAVLAGILISPFAHKAAWAGIWGYSPFQIYLGVEGAAAVAAFFLFAWLGGFVMEFVLLFLRPDYPCLKGVHHDHYPLHVESGEVVYHEITFRDKYTALFLAPFAILINLWRDLSRGYNQYWDQLSEEERADHLQASSFTPDL